jgi:hypothetical protein
MRGKQDKSVVLACFSPPVMIATFAIEIVLALYTLVRYKMGAKSRSVMALLVCLAAFQFAEYFVCTHSAISIGAARAGYIAITALPALGLYLMGLLGKPLSKQLNTAVFGVTALMAAYFLLAPNVFDSYICTGNYVIFQIGLWPARLYGAFYFGLIAWSLVRGALFLRGKSAGKKAEAVRWLIIGYVVFIMPVAILTVLHPDTRQAVPSILCGFAVSFAIILAGFVAPLSLKAKR